MTRIVTGQLDAYLEPGPRHDRGGARGCGRRSSRSAAAPSSTTRPTTSRPPSCASRRPAPSSPTPTARRSRPAAARVRRTSTRCPAWRRRTRSCTRCVLAEVERGIERLPRAPLRLTALRRRISRSAREAAPVSIRQAPLLQPVSVGHKALGDYRHLVGRPLVEEIRELAAPLQGKRVLHVSATAMGGGVSEILYALVPLMRDVGLDADWHIVLGREEFFNVTKLHAQRAPGRPARPHRGGLGDLRPLQRDERARDRRRTGTYVHRPRPAAGRAATRSSPTRPRRWIWRCHIDLSTPNTDTIERLVPLLEPYDAWSSTCRTTCPTGVDGKVEIVPPAIDPLSPKNMALSPEDAAFVCDQFGVDVDRPLICQVSRFDPWKDPLGVIDAYRLVKEEHAGRAARARRLDGDRRPRGLGLLPGDASSTPPATRTSRSSTTSTTSARSRSTRSSRRPTCCCRSRPARASASRSPRRSGRARPSIGGNVGGIPLQIEDGSPASSSTRLEECAAARARDPRGPRAGQAARPAGKEHVRDALPDAAPAARLAADLHRAKLMSADVPASDADRRWSSSPTAARRPSSATTRASWSSAAAAAW